MLLPLPPVCFSSLNLFTPESAFSIYKASDLPDPARYNSAAASVSVGPCLFFCRPLAKYIRPLPRVVPLPFQNSKCSSYPAPSLCRSLLKSCRQKQDGAKLSQRYPPPHPLYPLLVCPVLVFLSSSSFKRHLFILKRGGRIHIKA